MRQVRRGDGPRVRQRHHQPLPVQLGHGALHPGGVGRQRGARLRHGLLQGELATVSPHFHISTSPHVHMSIVFMQNAVNIVKFKFTCKSDDSYSYTVCTSNNSVRSIHSSQTSSQYNFFKMSLAPSLQGSFYETLIVCNYAVAGNLLGSAMYEAGSACSSCPARKSLLQGVISQL